jgi:hypothetical protein
MSWAAHDPEGWAEVESTAVQDGLTAAWTLCFNEAPDNDFLDMLLALTRDEAPQVYAAMVDEWGAPHIGEATRDYLDTRYGS